MGRSIQMGSVSGVSGRWIGRLCWICEVLGDTPWQQFVNTVDRVIGNIGQDMAQVSARVDTIEFAAADERVHRGCPLAPAVGASKEEILATKTYTTQRVLGEVVVYFRRAISAVQCQRSPLVERVVDRLGRVGFCRQRLELRPEPGLVGFEQRFGLLLPHTQPFGGLLARMLASMP